MSAPAEITLKDLTGDWVMSKALSDDSDPVLALQGMGWLTRKAINLATITLHVKQYTEGNKIHIDIEQTATGGIKGTTELRVLDGVQVIHKDHIFGDIKGSSNWAHLDDIKGDAYLKEGWLSENEEAGPNGEKHIESFAKNESKGWEAAQVWGFAIVDGSRHYVRRVVVKKGKEEVRVRLVYTWAGRK